jgi:hypothetical protein
VGGWFWEGFGRLEGIVGPFRYLSPQASDSTRAA